MGTKVFYKYRPANNFTIALLEKQEMKFSCADEYNDPFDSKLTINKNDDIDSTLQQLEETPIGEGEKLVVRERIRSGNFKNQLVEASRIAARRTIMSSCFAGNSDNLPLWSHYADSHKGVCIGLRDCSSTDIPGMKFNIDIEDCCPNPDGSFDGSFSEGLFPVYKVNYSDSGIVEWDPSVDNFKIFIDAHMNKAKCWEYEDEYRLIVATKAFRSKILCFDPRYLVEVYLGCCIEVGFRTKVLQILKANYLSKGIDVKVFEMVRSKKRFALEKKELGI